MKVSYEEIGQVLVTCPAAAGVAEGGMVTLGTDGKAAPCKKGERFFGQAVSVAEDGFAAVQVRGFITVACADGTVAPGWAALAGDGAGGVEKAVEGGGEVLVMEADGERAVLCL